MVPWHGRSPQPSILASWEVFICSSIACDQLMTILKLAIVAPRRSPTTAALNIHILPSQHPTSCYSPACAEPRIPPSEAADGACTIASRNATAAEPSIRICTSLRNHRVQRADCCAARITWYNIPPSLLNKGLSPLGEVIMVVVQLLFSRPNTVPRYIVILLSRSTILPRNTRFSPSCVRVVHTGRTANLSLQRLKLFSQVSQGWCCQLSLID
jgi:hypothetical protein